MTVEFRRKGDKARYRFTALNCINAQCWALGMYQHRGATMSGSRNTGQESACCMHNAYHGCPNESDRGFDPKLGQERKAEGWRRA